MVHRNYLFRRSPCNYVWSTETSNYCIIFPHNFSLWLFIHKECNNDNWFYWGILQTNQLSMDLIICEFWSLIDILQHYKSKKNFTIEVQKIIIPSRIWSFNWLVHKNYERYRFRALINEIKIIWLAHLRKASTTLVN